MAECIYRDCKATDGIATELRRMPLVSALFSIFSSTFTRPLPNFVCDVSCHLFRTNSE
jgi:hypothetical protein